VTFVALQMVFVVPFAILDSVFKLRLVAHPAVLGVINLSACALVMTMGWLIGRPAMAEVFSLRRVSGPTIGSVIVASAGAIILLSEADNLVRFILPAPEWIVRIFKELSAPSEHLWASVFLLVMVAPLTEEVMFRGLILRAFLQRFSVGTAFLVSSMLFGLVHLNPWQFVSASALGLMFAWWYARTRSLVPSLIGHAQANAMVVGNAWLPFQVRGFNAGDPFAGAGFQPAWFDALGVLLLAAGLWLFHRLTPAAQVRVKPSSDSQSLRVPSSPDPPST
jgi:membrane protease YdiL (CAAX protease family)